MTSSHEQFLADGDANKRDTLSISWQGSSYKRGLRTGTFARASQCDLSTAAQTVCQWRYLPFEFFTVALVTHA